MKKVIVSICLLAVVIIGCHKVPITNRKQLNLLPETELIGMSLTAYQEFLTENPPVKSGSKDEKLVKRLGQEISVAVEEFMKQEGLSKRLEGYAWEFNLVNDNTVNAWCMPGGKVVVYSGLLQVTQNEDALACVMGHEIAHAIARHGNERMSKGLLIQAGGMALSVALSQKPKLVHDLFLQSYGISSSLGMLKYSRMNETEADKLGLIFMAMAGYNPSEAVNLWIRMGEASGGQAPPEFLSTHPSNETRIADIKAYLPTAMKYYKKKG